MKKIAQKIQTLRLRTEDIRTLGRAHLSQPAGGSGNGSGDSCDWGAFGCRKSYGQCDSKPVLQ